jgi:hypothetical protein
MQFFTMIVLICKDFVKITGRMALEKDKSKNLQL